MSTREPMSNVGPVCAAHAPKPDPRLTKKPAEFFIGRFVKKAFKTNAKEPQPQVEHMWVEVKKVEGGKLVGLLNNDPFFCDIQCGDEVKMEVAEVEELLD